MASPDNATAPSPALDGADAVILDCDGVLVDVAASYDQTIALTVSRLLQRYPHAAPLDADAALIELFKETGGFNDEVDLAYAAILCAVAAGAAGKDGRELTAGVCSAIGPAGISGVESQLKETAGMQDVIDALGHPGKGSVVRTEFNSIFYGDGAERGMIDSDALLVDVSTVRRLRNATGRRPAVVTGRGREAFGHTVCDPLRSEFDMSSSAFLEDEPRSMAKPNPEALIAAIKGVGASRTIYVGDSMEDLMMARGAADAGHDVTFCGIAGTARDPAVRRRMFEGAGADVAVESVKELAKLLEKHCVS